MQLVGNIANELIEITYKSKIKSVICSYYSSEKLIALNNLHEVVPTWYSFQNCVDGSNANKVSCSRTQHTDAGVRNFNLYIQKPTF